MFVHPGQVAQITSRFPHIKKARLVLTGRIGKDKMEVRCELVPGSSSAGLALQVEEVVREVTRLRAEIQFVASGTLPEDGKLIEDARDYS
jgi:phenylacetate-CoA ligase